MNWICLSCGRRLRRTRAPIRASMRPPACPLHGSRQAALSLPPTPENGPRLLWQSEWTRPRRTP
jgi:hypothetical protein